MKTREEGSRKQLVHVSECYCEGRKEAARVIIMVMLGSLCYLLVDVIKGSKNE